MDEPQQTELGRFAQRAEEVWAILVMRWRIVIFFTVAVVLIALVGTALTTPIFVAATVIHVSPVWGQEFKVEQVLNEELNRIRNTRQFYRTEMEIMQSRPVLQMVSDRFAEAFPEDEVVGTGAIKEAMSIVPVKSSELLTVLVHWPDAEQAAAMANLITDVYTRNNLDSRRGSSRDARVYLASRLDEFELLITDASRRLLDYQTDNDLADAAEEITELSSRMRALSEAKGEKTTERVLLESTVTGHERLLSQRNYSELAKDMDTSLILEYSREYADAMSQNARIGARYGERHPERQASQALVNRLEEELRRQVEQTLAAEHVKLDMLRQKETDLQSALGEAKGQLLERQLLTSQYEGLRLELEQVREFHEALRQRDHELELASRTQLNNIRVVEQAIMPSSPVSPDLLMNFLAALFTGLLGGLAIALVRHYLDDRLSSPFEIATFLRIPYLGMIPRIDESVQGRDRALYTHEHSTSAAAEAVRAIRTLIELDPETALEEGQARRLMLTSAISSEGKTETSVRLGVSYANLGRKVVIVDCDLRRARVHRVFGIDRKPGLTEVLQGKAGLDDAIMPTDIPNVFALRAGSVVERPNELLASIETTRTLADLDKRFDVIIIDTPPVGFLSDALLLSRSVDGVVLVVRDQAVSRRLVRESVNRLQQVGAKLLGVIVNDVAPLAGARYGYYSYGYGYGYSYKYEESDDAAAK